MELQELKNIWQAYDTKLEKSMKLNLHCFELLQSHKVRSKLRSLLILRIIEIIMHLFVLRWLGNFLYTHFFEWQFAVAAALLMLFFMIAAINCIKQVVLIKQIDYSENITDIQTKLNSLHAHVVDYIRLTFLVLPTYMAYPIVAFKALGNFDITQINHKWWMAQLIFSALMIPASIWLYRQVSYKNMHKKWVSFILKNSVGKSVTDAMAFTKEIDEFKKETL